jgi:hypothetical protein
MEASPLRTSSVICDPTPPVAPAKERSDKERNTWGGLPAQAAAIEVSDRVIVLNCGA